MSVAVVGLACRVPGAPDAETFWRNLCDGVESISRFSETELLAAGVEPALVRHPDYVPAAGALEDIERFDAAFFGFTPREAEWLDVQQRLFLECAWQALEDACCVPERQGGVVGVYAGAGFNSYLVNNLAPHRERIAAVGGFETMIANDKDFLSTRVSYKLNLGGPSVGVQTACSTSLVAVHLACQALLGGECDVALAGGVSVRVPHRVGYLYREGMILSPDGHCRAFDINGAGTVGGSGVGVVVLKRLEDAVADGDAIRAVVRGSAINNDGGRKVGYTAPSVDGQREVIGEALAVAGVAPETIGFIETHGTGTRLGDPVEFQALREALPRPGRGVCALGSVKTNIGHLDAAAGVAGFIKTVLAVEHGLIPPTLHFTRPNREMALTGSPFSINTALRVWTEDAGPRRAGVSSFGIGGTNAHVVLEQAPTVSAAPPRTAAPGPHVLLVSARDPASLARATTRLAATVRRLEPARLGDLAWSLQSGRTVFPHRAAVVDRDAAPLAATLERADTAAAASGRTVVWMFPGQGAQHAGMAAGLYRAEPVFRDAFDICADTVGPRLGHDLRRVLGMAEPQSGAAALLAQTAVAQPALFSVEYALAQLLRAWGIVPDVVIGHSVGEYAAATVAGVMPLPDALAAVLERGRLMQTLAPGRMVAVGLSERQLAGLVTPPLSVAAVNGDQLCVVSGPLDAVASFEHRCSERGVICRPLETSHAFHSSMMEPILPRFREAIDGGGSGRASVSWVSSVTGLVVGDTDIGPDYWVRQIREPVRFADALGTALARPHPVLLEVGPGHTLTTLAAAHPRAGDVVTVPLMRPRPSPKPARSAVEPADDAVLLQAMARLWTTTSSTTTTTGAVVTWDAVRPAAGRSRMSLPAYPFLGPRYWVDPPSQLPTGDRAEASTSGDDRRPLADWFYTPVWTPAPAPAAANRPGALGVWLFLVHDGDPLGVSLAARARARGATVALVVPGTTYGRAGDRFTVRPASPADYEQLCADLTLGATRVDVLHAWCLPAPVSTDRAPTAHTDMTSLDAGFHSLFGLTRALSAVAADLPGGGGAAGATTRLHVVTPVSSPSGSGVEDSVVAAVHAAVQGPLRVGTRECPTLLGRAIQVTSPVGDRGLAALVDQLDRELISGGDGADVLYGDGRRQIRVMTPLRLPPAPSADRSADAAGGPDTPPRPGHAPRPFREGGHYLITGGLGGLGLVIAGHFAVRCQARVTLVGRTAMPPETSWDGWLSQHATDDPVSGRIRQLRQIAAVGGQVWVATADVADATALAEAVRSAVARHGPVHGVVHAAGVPAGGLIAGRTRAQIDEVFRPKVAGALNLARVFGVEPLDFLVLMSSLTAVLGEVGQVDYCAANAVLDELALRLRALGCPACSINWDTWRETGMAARASAPAGLETLRARRLGAAILNDEGLEVLERVLMSDLARVVVSTRDLDTRVTEEARPFQMPVPDQGGDGHPRPVLSVPFTEAEGPTEQVVGRLWESVLGVDGVGRHDDFFELGGHSLLATQLLARLRDQLGVRVSLGAFFDEPSVAALARAVEASQLDAVVAEVEQLSEAEAERALRADDGLDR